LSFKSVAIVNRKGGVGKTTLATILAEQALIKGKYAACYDLDPQNNFTVSMKYFMQDKEMEYKDKIFIVGPNGEIEVPDETDILMVIDCPPVVEEITQKGMETADKILVPVMSDIFSMMNLEYVYKLAEKAGKFRDDISLVTVGFNQERRGGKLAKEIQEEFKTRGYNIFDVPVNRMIPINIAMGKRWSWGIGLELQLPFLKLFEEVNK
jgi:cellulose biosynthesis protein BcsQ